MELLRTGSIGNDVDITTLPIRKQDIVILQNWSKIKHTLSLVSYKKVEDENAFGCAK